MLCKKCNLSCLGGNVIFIIGILMIKIYSEELFVENENLE